MALWSLRLASKATLGANIGAKRAATGQLQAWSPPGVPFQVPKMAPEVIQTEPKVTKIRSKVRNVKAASLT